MERPQLGETASVQRACVRVLSEHAGGNVEDTVSSRLHGNHISFTGKEAEHVHVQNVARELFHIVRRFVLVNWYY